MSAGDSWSCLASAGSRPLLLAWPSLGLPKLSSTGPAKPSGSDPGLELEGRGAASLHCGRVPPPPPPPARNRGSDSWVTRREEAKTALSPGHSCGSAFNTPVLPRLAQALSFPHPSSTPRCLRQGYSARVAMRSLLVWTVVRRSGPGTQCRGRGPRRRLLGCS